jgi:drug/metabolite transporter (DMT)-like permease
VQEMRPITLVAYRVLFGLLFGIAVILIQRVSLRRSFQEWRPLLLLGITNIAIPFFLISWGHRLGSGCHFGCYRPLVYHFACSFFIAR